MPSIKAPKIKKDYDDYEIEFSLKSTSRKGMRDAVVKKFLEEKSGYWKDNVKHVTRYKYYVEVLDDGRRIFLLRPTFLNKGIDFQVWVERLFGEKDQRPSHKDMMKDLEKKRDKDPKTFKILKKAIDLVWNCEEPDEALKDLKEIKFVGFPPCLVLKVLKWLFIEQDVTYWNYDGRRMLKLAIDQLANN